MGQEVQGLRALLRAGDGKALAITAPGLAPLRFAALRDQVDRTGEALNAVGIGRGDRVAIVEPNGPLMATAFLGVASAASAAPLNPAYRLEEFAYYLDDLKPRALMVRAGSSSPAIEAAARLGIPVLAMQPGPERGAGGFSIEGAGPGGRAERDGPAEGEDEALALHTSGTTSRPKMVPLSQSNLAASAANIMDSLDLSEADRGLVLMPLFHIHGLMAGLVAPLAAAGQAACPPDFNGLKVFGWIAEHQPSWFTAVPSMHQAILARAVRNAEAVRGFRPRMLRSSSSPLAPRLMGELESAFGAPVVECYGMTEACHQICANPLPPRERKPGKVGVPAGTEVGVMDRQGRLLASGQKGEVVIRGPNVTRGYHANPEANRAAFQDGWFRTGDEGWIDVDGYLALTGRLKEIINRAGEKVSPYEVEAVLMLHPDVEQAVSFAVPHARLGEEVGAAVVLREGAAADERSLRDFAGGRLAAFKAPRRILVLEEIPKGATGKLQRIGMAERLGL